MRTTLDLPDDVMRAVKVRAAQTDASLTETIATLLRAGLVASEGAVVGERVTLPLVRTARNATERELSAARVAEILIADEVQDLTVTS